MAGKVIEVAQQRNAGGLSSRGACWPVIVQLTCNRLRLCPKCIIAVPVKIDARASKLICGNFSNKHSQLSNKS